MVLFGSTGDVGFDVFVFVEALVLLEEVVFRIEELLEFIALLLELLAGGEGSLTSVTLSIQGPINP